MANTPDLWRHRKWRYLLEAQVCPDCGSQFLPSRVVCPICKPGVMVEDSLQERSDEPGEFGIIAAGLFANVEVARSEIGKE